MAELPTLLQGVGTDPRAIKYGVHEEEEGQEEGELGEVEEGVLHGEALRGRLHFPKGSRTPTNQASLLRGWDHQQQTSQVTGPFVENLQEVNEGESKLQNPQSVIQEMESPHPQTIISETVHMKYIFRTGVPLQ